MHISDDVNDSNEKSHQAWIVPAWFKPPCHIKDLRYLKGNRTPGMVQHENEKTENVGLLQTIVPEGSSNMKHWNIMCINTS